MLIHISRLNDDQSSIYRMVSELIDDWKSKSESYFSDGVEFREMLEQRWNEEFSVNDGIENFSEFADLLRGEQISFIP